MTTFIFSTCQTFSLLCFIIRGWSHHSSRQHHRPVYGASFGSRQSDNQVLGDDQKLGSVFSPRPQFPYAATWKQHNSHNGSDFWVLINRRLMFVGILLDHGWSQLIHIQVFIRIIMK